MQSGFPWFIVGFICPYLEEIGIIFLSILFGKNGQIKGQW